jgi:hypothetical protein
MGMVAPIYYTAEMVRALPEDGNRYEVVHGELLVTPARRPWHEVIVGRLYGALQSPAARARFLRAVRGRAGRDVGAGPGSPRAASRGARRRQCLRPATQGTSTVPLQPCYWATDREIVWSTATVAVPQPRDELRAALKRLG